MEKRIDQYQLTIAKTIDDIKNVIQSSTSSNQHTVPLIPNNFPSLEYRSYADVASQKKTPNDQIRNVRSINDDTTVLQSLKSDTRFHSVPIKSVISKSDKAFTVKFNNKEDAIRFDKTLSETYKNKVSVSMPKTPTPSFKIVGLTSPLSDDDLIKTIITCNDFIKPDAISIVRRY